MSKKSSSHLSEKKGISQPETTNKHVAQSILKKRAKQPTVSEFVTGILKGDITLLSRAITLVESTQAKHLEKANTIIAHCLPHTKKAIRIGITGVPGVGKSTFIEVLGKHITAQGKKVAVLAVDPSSSVNKGSILGDKTRMEELVTDPKAFIRPSPSGTSLGGVAQKTRETVVLCEAAGFDTIIIETVGVGQSETAVHSMVDFFLLLKLAGAGDELQGIKRGIIEMADAIVINKADGDNKRAAKHAKTEFTRALHLYPAKENGWIPKVVTASALENKGISDVFHLIENFIETAQNNGSFSARRKEQNQYWLTATIEQYLHNSFYNHREIQNLLKEEIEKIEKGITTPFQSANKLLKKYNE